METSEIIINQTADGETRLDVRMENDSVWLTQAQIAQLFGTEIPAISKHIRNIFQSGELETGSTVSKMEIVRQEGSRTVKRRIDIYSLDMILSVGYRVNSKNATQFRIWSNKVLKEYLIKGYAVNQQAKVEQLEELKHTVHLLSNVLTAKAVTKSEAVGLLRVITDYTYGLDTLDRYDFQQLEMSATTADEPFHATYENAINALQVLRDKFGGSDLFAHEKDESFKGTMGAIYQTFGGRDLYPSVEEKAANLLYLTVKNQSFSDEVLEELHRQAPEIRLEKLFFCKLWGLPVIFDGGFSRLSFEKYAYVRSFNIHHRSLNKRLLKKIHRHGQQVKIWTADDPSRTAKLPVDGVITNRPDRWVDR